MQTTEEAAKEVIEVLQKAISVCDLDENHPKYPLYVYRAGMIYYRIASLYHNQVWTDPNNSPNKRNIIQLAKINYDKAAKMYFQSSDANKYLRTQMQKFALFEHMEKSK